MPGTERAPTFFEICCQILDGTYGSIAQSIGIIALVLIFNFIVKVVLLKLRERFRSDGKIWKLSFVSALYKPLSYFVWLFAALSTLDIITYSLLSAHYIDLHLMLTIGAVLSFGWFLLRWNSKILQYALIMSENHEINITPAKLDLISKLATLGTLLFTLFLLMETTGRSVQTLIAFGGIGGLALAFASQKVISNFFGGLMIYLTHPFTIGEWVNLPDRKIEGHIEEIGWYMTRIRNFEKRPIYVPNSIFTETIVITPSRMSHQRIHEKIGIRCEPAVLKKIVEETKTMLLNHAKIDRQQKVETYLATFGTWALTIEISAYVLSTYNAEFNSIRQDVLFKVADIITNNGAQVAGPTSMIELPSDFPAGLSIQNTDPALIPAPAKA